MIKKAQTVPHIRLDEHDRAWLDDTNIKVIEVVLDHLAYGWNAETIQENHPQLSLAQVYAALAWYYDHQAEMDAEVERQDERIRALRAASQPSALQRRLATRRRKWKRLRWSRSRPSWLASINADSRSENIFAGERIPRRVPTQFFGFSRHFEQFCGLGR